MTALAAGPLDQPVGWLIAAVCVLWLGITVAIVARGGLRTPPTSYRDEVLRDQPIGYWPLGQNLRDESGHERHGRWSDHDADGNPL